VGVSAFIIIWSLNLEVSELINTFLLPLGGVSTFVMALAAFVGNVNAKRIINNELAQHKLKLENLSSENKIRLETLKLDYTNKLENQKLESVHQLEKTKAALQKDIIKHDIYSAMSKDKFQELFQKRIDVYEKLISLKNEIDKSVNDDIGAYFFMDDNPRPFIESIKKVNEATRNNTMLVSNELASLSENLFEISSQIFLAAEAESTYADIYSQHSKAHAYEMEMEAQNNVSSKLSNQCLDIYNKWFEQLEMDVSKIRSTLDITSDFIGNKH